MTRSKKTKKTKTRGRADRQAASAAPRRRVEESAPYELRLWFQAESKRFRLEVEQAMKRRDRWDQAYYLGRSHAFSTAARELAKLETP